MDKHLINYTLTIYGDDIKTLQQKAHNLYKSIGIHYDNKKDLKLKMSFPFLNEGDHLTILINSNKLIDDFIFNRALQYDIKEAKLSIYNITPELLKQKNYTSIVLWSYYDRESRSFGSYNVEIENKKNNKITKNKYDRAVDSYDYIHNYIDVMNQENIIDKWHFDDVITDWYKESIKEQYYINKEEYLEENEIKEIDKALKILFKQKENQLKP